MSSYTKEGSFTSYGTADVFRTSRQLAPAKKPAGLGEPFEEKEHSLFSEDGFEKMVNRMAAIEKGLGLYDLAHFTASR